MATVRELVTKLGFEVDSSAIKQYEKHIAATKASVKALAVTITAAAGTIFGIAKLTANHGEEASKLSQRLGVTTDAYQEMTFAAHMADIGTEEFNQSMGILVRTMGQARSGSKQAGAGFAQAGGNVAALVRSGASADQVLIALSDRFQQIKDPAKKAALAQELFGRSGARMIPFLNKGSKEMKELFERAREYGLVLDQETIDASNEFNDGLKELTAQGQGLKNIVGSGLVKALAPLIKQLVRWVNVNRKVLASGIGDFLTGLVEVVRVAFSVLGKLLNILIALVKPLGGLGNALKIVVAGFAAFKALQLLTALGGMVQLVFRLAQGFRLAGLAATIMNAKALLIPLLIGAAIAFLILAIEDVIGFFNGKDSVTAIIVEKFREAWDYVVNITKTAVQSVIDWFAMIPEKLGPIFDIIKFLFMNSPLGLAIRGSQFLFEQAQALFPPTVPIEGAVPGQGAANQRTLNNSINAPMTFNMGAGQAEPEKVGTTVYDNLDELLRTSSRNMQSGVAY